VRWEKEKNERIIILYERSSKEKKIRKDEWKSLISRIFLGKKLVLGGRLNFWIEGIQISNKSH
jgi:hypothetical protein